MNKIKKIRKDTLGRTRPVKNYSDSQIEQMDKLYNRMKELKHEARAPKCLHSASAETKQGDPLR